MQTLRDFYADEPFVRVVDHLPGTKDTAAQQLLRHHRPGGSRPGADDQLSGQSDQGGVGRRRAELQLDVRFSGNHRAVACISPAPQGRLRQPRPLLQKSEKSSMSIRVPQGFLLSGVHCRIKRDPQKPDLALVDVGGARRPAWACTRRTWSAPPRSSWIAAARRATGFARW